MGAKELVKAKKMVEETLYKKEQLTSANLQVVINILRERNESLQQLLKLSMAGPINVLILFSCFAFLKK